MNRRALLACAAAVAAGVATPLAAQSPGGRRGGARGDVSGEGRVPVDQLELTLHEFEEDLKLTRAQEPLWERYAAAVRALAADVAREQGPRTAEANSQDVLKRFERTVDRARNRVAALEDIGDAARALYATLTPEQRRAADPRLATLPAGLLTQQASVPTDLPGPPPGRPQGR